MIEPKNIEIDGKTYIISKFPAVAGRRIVAGYPLSSIPKLGDYEANEEIMLKLMAYVAVPRDAGMTPLRLENQALVDNHVKSWETLGKIEMAMLEYNVSFLANGRISNFFEGIARNIPEWIIKTLTLFSAASSQKEKPLSTN